MLVHFEELVKNNIQAENQFDRTSFCVRTNRVCSRKKKYNVKSFKPYLGFFFSLTQTRFVHYKMKSDQIDFWHEIFAR